MGRVILGLVYSDSPDAPADVGPKAFLSVRLEVTENVFDARAPLWFGPWVNEQPPLPPARQAARLRGVVTVHDSRNGFQPGAGVYEEPWSPRGI